MAEPIKFNVNWPVCIHLTERGARFLTDYLHHPRHQYQAGDVYEDSLWAIMSIFGPELLPGFGEFLYFDPQIELIPGDVI